MNLDKAKELVKHSCPNCGGVLKILPRKIGKIESYSLACDSCSRKWGYGVNLFEAIIWKQENPEKKLEERVGVTNANATILRGKHSGPPICKKCGWDSREHPNKLKIDHILEHTSGYNSRKLNLSKKEVNRLIQRYFTSPRKYKSGKKRKAAIRHWINKGKQYQI